MPLTHLPRSPWRYRTWTWAWQTPLLWCQWVVRRHRHWSCVAHQSQTNSGLQSKSSNHHSDPRSELTETAYNLPDLIYQILTRLTKSTHLFRGWLFYFSDTQAQIVQNLLSFSFGFFFFWPGSSRLYSEEDIISYSSCCNKACTHWLVSTGPRCQWGVGSSRGRGFLRGGSLDKKRHIKGPFYT